MVRYAYFVIAIIVGLGLGLFYGWVISPVELVETSPSSLRADYRTDYVLMVAEAYSVDANLSLAVRRLGLLGDESPVESVEQATVFAVEYGYAPADLVLIQDLGNVMRTWSPALEPSEP